jgi:hypothetical protein
VIDFSPILTYKLGRPAFRKPPFQAAQKAFMNSKLFLSIVCALALCLPTLLRAEGHSTKTRSPRSSPAAKHHAEKSSKRAQKAEEIKKKHPNAKPATRDPGVNSRQENQKDRIKQGIRSGQLTKEETQQLKETQKDIRTEEKEYKADGTVTKEERKDLHQDLNEASQEIYQEKHDAETQPGVTPAEPGDPSTRDPGVNTRQENQQDRIKQGVRTGELTKKEVLQLEQKEKRLAHLEKRLKQDGSLTAQERERLQKELNALSSEIYKQKHDAQER